MVKKGACMRCKARKVKCEWIGGASMCKACESNGLQAECMAAGTGSKPPSEGTVQRATRSQSIPPGISMVVDSISAALEDSGQVQDSTRVAGRKRSFSQTTSASQTSELDHQHTRTRRNLLDSGLSTSSLTRTSSASMKTTLEAITEFDEDSQFTGHSTAVSTGTDTSLNSQQYKRATAFASLVRAVSSNDSDNGSGISDDSDSDMEIVTDIDPKVKPGRNPTGKKPGRKPLSSSSKKDESDLDNGDEYDPATCGAFA